MNHQTILRKIYITKIFVIILGAACFAPRAESMVFIEQFTSTECRICEKGEDILEEIAAQNNALIISYHVDYWDYLGKPDPFANPFFAQRQIVYQYQYGERYIYTPQAIINGTISVDAADLVAMQEAIAQSQSEEEITIIVAKNQSQMAITINPKPEQELKAGVYSIILARILPNGTAQNSENGKENERRIARNHVVDALDSLGQWNGKDPFTANVPIPENAELMIFVQEGSVGKIIGAKLISPL